MRRRGILLFLLVISLTGPGADIRTGGIDFFILVDTSLSMAEPFADAKKYIAGEIIGRLVEQDDWISLVRFFGKTETVWSGDVRSTQDMASLVRSLNLLEADGRFTDIGLALDYVDALVMQRGNPERPKYIVLITDERQEAPKETKYYSNDYSISHPLLEYIKRIDLGGFRLITVGYGLTARVEGNARSLITTLASPPETRTQALAGSDAPANIPDGSKKSNEMPSGIPNLVLVAIVSVVIPAIIFGVILVARRRRKSENDDVKKPVEPAK
jgi:hypothetical protein